MRFPMQKLMNPSSVAVVGASTRPAAVGSAVIGNLQKLGYPGRIYPINPRYSEVSGLRCYPSLRALPETVDAVFIGIPAQGGPDVLEEAAACGVGAAVINASGYADGGPEGAALQARLQATAHHHRIALCGPNNVGLANVHNRAALWTIRSAEFRPGQVAVVSQSGSASMILCEDPKNLGLAYAVTSGNEAVLTAADYLEYMVREDRVKLILMFLETIRAPKQFGLAADEAEARGKRIILMKVGRSEGGQAAVRAHTAAIAGDDRVYSAFFIKHGIIRVDDFDEMLETAALFAAYPSPPVTPHIVPITLSGGEAALVADMGATEGLSMPPLSEATIERIRPALAPSATPRNPLDAWGLGWDPARFADLIAALLADPEVGTIVPAVDMPASGRGDANMALDMARVLASLAPSTVKRFVVFNNASAGGTDARVSELLSGAGIPCLLGMREALAALGNWARHRRPPPTDELRLVPTAEAWKNRVHGLDALGEPDRFRLLADAGVPMVDCRLVKTEEAAVDEAGRLGYPVSLKASGPKIAHKSELGLIRLGLADAGAVRLAFRDLSAQLRRLPDRDAHTVLQPMVGPGVELIAGVRNDPAFGPVVVAGLGGVHVEVFGEVSVRLGPVDRATALKMFSETRAGVLLRGVRGRGPYDAEAAAEAVVALSRFAAATQGVLAAVEVNPLVVLEKGRGAVGVDALLEAGSKDGGGER